MRNGVGIATPTEEVYRVGQCAIADVGVADGVVLLFGKRPCVATSGVLQVAFLKIDIFSVGHFEFRGQRTQLPRLQTTDRQAHDCQNDDFFHKKSPFFADWRFFLLKKTEMHIAVVAMLDKVRMCVETVVFAVFEYKNAARA